MHPACLLPSVWVSVTPEKGSLVKRLIAILTGIDIMLLGIVGVTTQAEAQVRGPNGRIVFIRSDSQGSNLAYTANPDGSHERLLFSGAADWARWSPAGNEVDVRHSDGLA